VGDERNKEYYFSPFAPDDENFYGPFSREEALDKAFAMAKDYGNKVVYLAPVEKPEFPDVSLDDLILDHLSEAAYEDFGDCTESWLEKVTPEHKKELETLVFDWVTKNYPPKWFTVGVIEEIEVPK
jgi:hypothetical protein